MRSNIMIDGGEVTVTGKAELITTIVNALQVFEERKEHKKADAKVKVSANISNAKMKRKYVKKVKQEVMLNSRWSSKEVNLINKFYGMKHTPKGFIKGRNMKRLLVALPHRSRSTIQAKAFNLGLTGKPKSKEFLMKKLLKRVGYDE